MKAKSFSVDEVLNNSRIGCSFEFYSSKDTTFIVEDLSRLTAKNVIVTNDERYTPTFSNALLIKEYEAKKPRYKFMLDLQQYHSMLPIIQEVNKWLKESAETTYDTLMKVSLSFNHHGLQTLQSISGMNPTKLILKFNENYVYDRFPLQKNSPYAFSIKHVVPVTNMYINETEITKNINNILLLPQNNYYGINFTNYTLGVLEFNYIGGKNYPEKQKEINEILEYYIIKTYQSLNEEDYYKFELDEVKRMTKDFTIIQMAYFDPDIFLREFKNLKVYIDLKTSPQLIKTMWSQIRDPLFETIIRGNFHSGQFNYDSAIGRYQIKGTEIIDANIKNFDFIKCNVNGVFENCNFWNTKINKSRLINSKLVKANDVSESYLNKVSANMGNIIANTFILNNDEILNCQIKESIIKFASIGNLAKLDETCTLIQKPDNASKMVVGISDIDVVRDYRWIKSLTMRHDKGFENAYDRKKYMKG
ncbi:MAG: hypothetical protein WC554_12875 [Clostridia bacterium]